MVGYSTKIDPENSARAIGYELRISPKHSVEICSKLRGMMLEDAKKYLEDVIALKKAIPFKRYKKYVGHRRGKGYGPGRFPQRAAKEILRLLEHVEHNAEYGGLDTENIQIVHMSAYRGRVYQGRMPRAHGRATEWNTETVNIEIIVEEIEEQ
ncbi:MAG: 50S ribosomal protein L22 [Thermoplasmata archaeon]|nr:MAG: 50S ribosomal protein L22 [Thermoplasmata archaeon]